MFPVSICIVGLIAPLLNEMPSVRGTPLALVLFTPVIAVIIGTRHWGRKLEALRLPA